MAALLVIVALALAWLNAGCSSTAIAPPRPVSDLQALDQQQLADWSCASQNPPHP
jgi:hypothetical protein